MARASAKRGFATVTSQFESTGKGSSYVTFGIEGIVLAILALYMIITPDSARDNIRLIAGLVFIVAGAYQLQRALSFYQANTHRTVVPVRFAGGGVLLFGGILIVLEKLSGHFNIDAARIVLASTLIAAGLFGILTSVLGRRDGDFKIGNVVASVILIVLAGFNISEVRSGDDKTRTIGFIVLLLGVVLLAYAYLLRQRMMDEPVVGDQETTYIEPQPEPYAAPTAHATAYDPNAAETPVSHPAYQDDVTAQPPAEPDRPFR